METTYTEAAEYARGLANLSGFDHGIEADRLNGGFRVFILPRAQSRCGHELRCEVVSADNLAKCQPGHGPGGGL
jgi:hypothetical protein